MKALEALFPVFFMMFLGYLARKKNWITREQDEGAKKIVFQILFPFLVYNVLVSSQLSQHLLVQILFLDAAWIIIYFIGKKTASFTSSQFSRISPFLLLTCEGGNVALPLYITMVGSAYAVNIVTFDVAGILINFGFVPAVIAKQISGRTDWKDVTKSIFTSSFVIAVLAGVLVNLSGLHSSLMDTSWGPVYTATAEMVIKPITGIILFTLGYELQIQRSFMKPLIRLAATRLICCGTIICLFFLLFPGLMADTIFRIGVIFYFLCPTGFPVPLQVTPLIKDSEEEAFMAAFLSLFMVIALVAYAVITVIYL